MAMWTVQVKAKVDMILEFEREVEADSELEAEMAAENAISEEELLEAIKNDDVVTGTWFDCDATTEEVGCNGCSTLFPKDDLDADGNCEECREEDEEEDEDEDEEEEEDDEDESGVEIEAPVK